MNVSGLSEVLSITSRDDGLEAEQTVLGALLLDNSAWLSLADRLTQSDFRHPKHQCIFEGIRSLCENNTPADLVTLSEWLKRRGQFDAAGGLSYLGQLINNTPSAANISTYADIVHEQSLLRQLAGVGRQIAESATRPNGLNADDLLNQAEQSVFEIAGGRQRHQGLTKASTLLEQALARIDQLSTQRGGLTGSSTGFTELDRFTNGLQTSDLIIVAGRPSMGKTAFSMNIAAHVATHQSLPVAVFSMEMSSEQLIMRLISSIAQIELQKVRSGQLDDPDWDKLTIATTHLESAPLFIDDTPALSPIELRTKLRRLAQAQGQLGLVVVDYLQLMQVPGAKENRVNEVSEISRSLKAIAKELRVPVIALSQLNRALEQRPDKRPKMADLRESGSIEQDADIILFVYRDEVYNEDTPDKGIAEVIIAKQRNGAIGHFRLTFRGIFTRFDNFVEDTAFYGES